MARTIWKDMIEPPSHDYLWYRLNEYNGLVGIFKYKEDKWVLIKKKELEEMMSGGNAEDIINQITNGAPQNLDSFAEVANVLNDLANVAYSGSYEDLADKPTIPTATSFKPFKSSWPTSTTIEAFCQAVMNDPDAVVGMAYFGALDCSGLPTGLLIGDTVVEILGSGNNKVVHLSISSTNLAPYNWEASYWQGHLYGWRTWENVANKVTSLSNSSTDTQYPSAKAVYDIVDAKYTKPIDGIPASDLALDVIPDVSNFVTETEIETINTRLDRLVSSEYITAWDGLSTPNVSLIPEGIDVEYNEITYTGTLAASAATMQKIYSVSIGNGNYDLYISSFDGVNYSWIPYGTTRIDLSEYIRQDSVVWLTEDEWNALIVKDPNITYNIYEEE